MVGEKEFRAQAEKLRQRFERARSVIVLSPQDLHIFTNVYLSMAFADTHFGIASYVYQCSREPLWIGNPAISGISTVVIWRVTAVQWAPHEVLRRITDEQPG